MYNTFKETFKGREPNLRQLHIDEINKNIDANKKIVNKKLAQKRESFPRTKTKRIRNEDERIALTEVAKASVKKAKEEKKFVVLDKGKIYYDPS